MGDQIVTDVAYELLTPRHRIKFTVADPARRLAVIA